MLAQDALAALVEAIERVEWAEPCLIHNDYWPGNTVWFRGRLSAVIDWTGAKLGDYRCDISQCRADLVVSHGLEVADSFLEAYEKHLGRRVTGLAFFDLFMGLRALVHFRHWLKGYQDAGLSHLTEAEAEPRLRAFVSRALAAVRG
jgi:aminoglycoside phosphotransferase (APT) family kinase protein